MLANGKSRRPHLVVGRSNSLSRCRQGQIPRRCDSRILGALPAMADSVLLLQVLLSGPAVNLRSVAEVIRSDVGLTIQLLRLAALEQDERHPIEVSITRSVVHAGIDKLLTLVTDIELLTSHPKGRTALRECEQFWAHAKLTALMAEELAYKTMYDDPEEAYIAGLLFHIGELPSILGWEGQYVDAEPREIARLLAQEWRLPPVLEGVVCNDDLSPCPSPALLKLVRAADEHAKHIQGLVARYARGVF